MPASPKITPGSAKAARAVKLYNSGKTLREVGAALGVDARTVRRAIDRAGYSIRPRHNQKP